MLRCGFRRTGGSAGQDHDRPPKLLGTEAEPAGRAAGPEPEHSPLQPRHWTKTQTPAGGTGWKATVDTSTASSGSYLRPSDALTLPGSYELTTRVKISRWHLDDPNLYRLGVTVATDTDPGTALHGISDAFGIRSVTKSGTDMLLNGQKIKLAGTNRVSDHPVDGNTEPVDQIRKDLDMMKSAGMNAMRIMHYAQSPELLDCADRIGMLLVTETPEWGVSVDQLKDLPNVKQQMLEQVQADCTTYVPRSSASTMPGAERASPVPGEAAGDAVRAGGGGGQRSAGGHRGDVAAVHRDLPEVPVDAGPRAVRGAQADVVQGGVAAETGAEALQVRLLPRPQPGHGPRAPDRVEGPGLPLLVGVEHQGQLAAPLEVGHQLHVHPDRLARDADQHQVAAVGEREVEIAGEAEESGAAVGSAAAGAGLAGVADLPGRHP
ncbi:hypothetical protein GTY41_11500 [Streptomyces sp. SID685]|nr:hypothetical protein [Streptomyces sp. SID685]